MNKTESGDIVASKGVWVWIKEDDEWKPAVLVQNVHMKDKVTIVVHIDGGMQELSVSKTFFFNHFPTYATKNFTELMYLHEPGMLRCLKHRLQVQEDIYTFSGPILIALNPNKTQHSIYKPDVARSYKDRSSSSMEPHIYAITEIAFQTISRTDSNASIVFSGDSGSGKTVNTGYAMRYFSEMNGNSSMALIEKKITAFENILEAFGNAKTTNNNNSSRFGKLIQLRFEKGTNMLQGATVKTYLLEFTRVVQRDTGERNFHIFYALCAARSLYPDLLLESSEDYNYLKSVDGGFSAPILEKKRFMDVVEAMVTLNFPKDIITGIRWTLAAILHLGNITFVKREDSNRCYISDEKRFLNRFCTLLEINQEKFKDAIVNRTVTVGREDIHGINDEAEARAIRDSFGKVLYVTLFRMIVKEINNGLSHQFSDVKFIALLDIFGFESNPSNSFEQFFINYANEKLQLQFQDQMFTKVQAEYSEEGIPWHPIQSHKNEECIKMIESPFGFMAMLNDECKKRGGNDTNFMSNLKKQCGHFECFKTSYTDSDIFVVIHFHKNVIYSTKGFVEKNRYKVPEKVIQVIKASTLPFCKRLGYKFEKDRDKLAKKCPTVALQYRQSLESLIKILNETVPNYVRCIQPSGANEPFGWNEARVTRQVRSLGALGAARLTANGYAYAYNATEFYNKFQLLCPLKELDANDLLRTSTKILESCLGQCGLFYFGRSKIFLRTCGNQYLLDLENKFRVAHVKVLQMLIWKYLERKKIKQHVAAIKIQKHMRGWFAWKRYQNFKRAACFIQSSLRSKLKARKNKNSFYHALDMKINQRLQYEQEQEEARIRALQHVAAIKIQKHMRGWFAWKRYQNFKRAACFIQSSLRSKLKARKNKNSFYHALDMKINQRLQYEQEQEEARIRALQHVAAIKIQKHMRGWLVRKQYQNFKRAACFIQSSLRSKLKARKNKRSLYHALDKKINQRLQYEQEQEQKVSAENAEENDLDFDTKLEKCLDEESKEYSEKESEGNSIEEQEQYKRVQVDEERPIEAITKISSPIFPTFTRVPFEVTYSINYATLKKESDVNLESSVDFVVEILSVQAEMPQNSQTEVPELFEDHNLAQNQLNEFLRKFLKYKLERTVVESGIKSAKFKLGRTLSEENIIERLLFKKLQDKMGDLHPVTNALILFKHMFSTFKKDAVKIVCGLLRGFANKIKISHKVHTIEDHLHWLKHLAILMKCLNQWVAEYYPNRPDLYQTPILMLANEIYKSLISRTESEIRSCIQQKCNGKILQHSPRKNSTPLCNLEHFRQLCKEVHLSRTCFDGLLNNIILNVSARISQDILSNYCDDKFFDLDKIFNNLSIIESWLSELKIFDAVESIAAVQGLLRLIRARYRTDAYSFDFIWRCAEPLATEIVMKALSIENTDELFPEEKQLMQKLNSRQGSKFYFNMKLNSIPNMDLLTMFDEIDWLYLNGPEEAYILHQSTLLIFDNEDTEE